MSTLFPPNWKQCNGKTLVICTSIPMYWQCLQENSREISMGSSTTNRNKCSNGWRRTSSWKDQLAIAPQTPLSNCPNSKRALKFSWNEPLNSAGYPFSPNTLNLNTLSPLFLFLKPLSSNWWDVFIRDQLTQLCSDEINLVQVKEERIKIVKILN